MGRRGAGVIVINCATGSGELVLEGPCCMDGRWIF